MAAGDTECSERFVLDFRQRETWRGRTHHYPVSPGEKEARTNLQSSQHFEGWDVTSHGNKVIWRLSWQACFLVTRGVLIPEGGGRHYFLVFTEHPLQGQLQVVWLHKSVPQGSRFHLKRISFSLLWWNIKISLSVIFPLIRVRKQSYSPLQPVKMETKQAGDFWS